jgi:DnaK suppressor protein
VTSDDLRLRLLAARTEAGGRADALRGELDDIIAAQADVATDDEHDPEGATIAFERARVAALLEKTQRTIDALDRAVARIDDGTYGTCDRCGGPIGAERLAARPAAETCISCAT